MEIREKCPASFWITLSANQPPLNVSLGPLSPPLSGPFSCSRHMRLYRRLTRLLAAALREGACCHVGVRQAKLAQASQAQNT